MIGWLAAGDIATVEPQLVVAGVILGMAEKLLCALDGGQRNSTSQ